MNNVLPWYKLINYQFISGYFILSSYEEEYIHF